MATKTADPLTHVKSRTADALPALPPLDSHLYAIHYSQELQANSPAQTPPVSAIVVQQVLSGQQQTFAAFQVAERRGISPTDFLTHLPELEKPLLKNFFAFVAQTPDALWLHWGMRNSRFGFEVLAQRARLHSIVPVDIPWQRRFDLSSYLKRRFGDDYVPHPRFWNALKRNGLRHPDLLNEPAAAAAWARGEYARLIVSLSCKVDGIVNLFERARKKTFQTSLSASKPEKKARGLSQTAEPVIPADDQRVVLRGLSEGPIVCGKEKAPLTPAQYDVVKALLDAGDRGLSKDELDHKSDRGEARKILKRLADSDEDWKAVIPFPGKAGGRYRIR